jgi:hypothetical protein
VEELHPLSAAAALCHCTVHVTLPGPTIRFYHLYPTEEQLALGLSSGFCAAQDEKTPHFI